MKAKQPSGRCIVISIRFLSRDPVRVLRLIGIMGSQAVYKGLNAIKKHAVQYLTIFTDKDAKPGALIRFAATISPIF